ncbi:RnfABCDGE type electron transport complex subunit B [Intestinibacillus massiliensis]|nr:RnfABCDGE type electron transport complex subunit B [Intestinibacillus massiliensis]
MDISNVISAVAVLFVMGVVFALLLGIAAKIFAVEVDERIPLVRECLPGANCGGCGFPGCDGLATAIVEGNAPVNGCPVGGAACAEKIAAVMGVDAGAGDKLVAHVHCNGGCNAADKAKYEGLQDCQAALRVAGGPKACQFACVGLGTCERACPFDAIHVVNGVATVDSEKCTACKKCVAACPQHIIDIVPDKCKVHVNCSSKAKGPEVMKVCTVGCIGCGLCEKTCKFDAIHVVNGVAVIDYDKCKNCKMCAKACPRGTIEPVPTAEEKEKFKAMQKAQAEKAKAAAAEKAAAAKAEEK